MSFGYGCGSGVGYRSSHESRFGRPRMDTRASPVGKDTTFVTLKFKKDVLVPYLYLKASDGS